MTISMIGNAIKHNPDILNPTRMQLAMIDMQIRTKVYLMRADGKSEDEILEAIEPIFEKYMLPRLEELKREDI